jgi:hypothetical protein
MSSKNKGGKKVFIKCACGFEYLKLSESEHFRTSKHKSILAGTWIEKEVCGNKLIFSTL